MIWMTALLATLLVMWIIQLVPVLLYVRRLSEVAPQQPALTKWPKIRIFMPLRGGDQSVCDSIRRALTLDYPSYEIQIVIDGEHDPAWCIVSDFLRTNPVNNVELVRLRKKLPTCSLLNSALVQFVEDLDESVDLIAFCGADMRVPKSFLRDLATAMADPKVGGTLGGRWYAPRRGRLGSLVRYIWNAGAIVPMWAGGIPWGGALTLRPRDIHASGLLDQWRHGMVEDAPVKSALRRLNLSLKFVPSLLIVNEEETNLGNCFRFITRQLLWTRLYHPQWALVLANVALFTSTMFAPFVAAIAFCFAGEPRLALGCLAGGLAYLAGSWALLLTLELGVRGVLHRQGELGLRLSPGMLLALFLVIPLTQLLYTLALVRCLFVKQVDWSGVSYQIHGPWQIELIRREAEAVTA